MLNPKLTQIDDKEGDFVPTCLPDVIDTHVHIFPKNLFAAIWQWFDIHAWPIRYQLSSQQVFQFLFSHGVKHVIALQYAHKPGIARMLNHYMANICHDFPHQVTGLATVLPGEDDAGEILTEAFALGLQGVKLHAHVQCFDMDSAEMEIIYQQCSHFNKPLIMHVGREPKSNAYLCDPYKICHVDKVERVLKTYPNLKICVPHFGYDELSQYRKLLEKFDTLWLDTTMILGEYFPATEKIDLAQYRMDRIMYGSDFPNIPYAWDRELKFLIKQDLSEERLNYVLHKSASLFFEF